MYNNNNNNNNYYYYYYFMWRCSPVAGYGLLLHEVFEITHKDAPQSVGLLWTSDQLVAETTT
jgi:hypothetical protein